MRVPKNAHVDLMSVIPKRNNIIKYIVLLFRRRPRPTGFMSLLFARVMFENYNHAVCHNMRIII